MILKFSLLDIEIIMRAKHITGYDRGELTAILFMIGFVLNINHSLGVRVAKVGRMWRSIVNHGFIYGITGLVRKDAGRKTRDDLLNVMFLTHCKNVVIHLHVVPEEVTVGAHVGKQPAHQSCQVYHMGWLVFLK